MKRIPALHRLFDEVLTDYKEKYGNGKGNEGMYTFQGRFLIALRLLHIYL